MPWYFFRQMWPNLVINLFSHFSKPTLFYIHLICISIFFKSNPIFYSKAFSAILFNSSLALSNVVNEWLSSVSIKNWSRWMKATLIATNKLFKKIFISSERLTAGKWSWDRISGDRNSRFSWDRNFCKIDQEIKTCILKNGSGDGKGPRGLG